MRLLERALIISTLGLFVSNLFTDFLTSKFLPIFLLHATLAILTLAYDGIRLAQVPILLSMVVYYILSALLISPVNPLMNSIGLALSLITCGLNLVFGECDFNKINPSG
jgi:succinate dehydrogenase hydrophobic anchor subunit